MYFSHLQNPDTVITLTVGTDTTVRSFSSIKGKHPSASMEKGIFGLGCPHADEMALRWVLQHSLDGDRSDAGQSSGSSSSSGSTRGGAVVVFGSGMDALAAVGCLIKNNVPSRLISLVISDTELEELGHQTVRPHSTHKTFKLTVLFHLTSLETISTFLIINCSFHLCSTFQINDSVYLALQECGVIVYPGHVVVDVTLNSHCLQAVKLENKMFIPRAIPPRGTGNILKDRVVPPTDNSGAPKVEPSAQFVTLECSSLLCCVRKSCDADVFAAINDSGLVYDGGIVVDEVSHETRFY